LSCASLTYPQIATMAGTLILFAIFLAFFHFSRFGTAMRAACDDQDAAALTGVNINRVFQLAWIMAAVVAAVGGIFLAQINYLNVGMGFIAIRVFPAVILEGWRAYRVPSWRVDHWIGREHGGWADQIGASGSDRLHHPYSHSAAPALRTFWREGNRKNLERNYAKQ